MKTLAGLVCDEKKYSYQHIQGTMLLKLNKLAPIINLKHSEYRLMGTLISLWNINNKIAFPTIDHLSLSCRMSKGTVIKNLNNLVKLNLIIIVKTDGKRNNYYFTAKILPDFYFKTTRNQTISTCKTRHVKKQIKNKLKKHDNKFKKIILKANLYNPLSQKNDVCLNNSIYIQKTASIWLKRIKKTYKSNKQDQLRCFFNDKINIKH